MKQIDLSSLAAFSSDKPNRVPLAAGQAARLVMLCLEPGQGVPAHSHPGHELSLHVLSGQLTLPREGEDDLILGPGQLIFADGAGSFAPRNDSAEPTRVLIHLIRRSEAGPE